MHRHQGEAQRPHHHVTLGQLRAGDSWTFSSGLDFTWEKLSITSTAMCEQKDWKLTRVLKMPCAELFHTHPWVRHLSQELTPKVPLFLAVGHFKDTLEASRTPLRPVEPNQAGIAWIPLAGKGSLKSGLQTERWAEGTLTHRTQKDHMAPSLSQQDVSQITAGSATQIAE